MKCRRCKIDVPEAFTEVCERCSCILCPECYSNGGCGHPTSTGTFDDPCLPELTPLDVLDSG